MTRSNILFLTISFCNLENGLAVRNINSFIKCVFNIAKYGIEKKIAYALKYSTHFALLVHHQEYMNLIEVD